MESDALLDYLIMQVASVLRVGGLRAESNFYLSGGDSLSALTLVSNIRRDLNLAVQPEDMPLWLSLADMAKWLSVQTKL